MSQPVSRRYSTGWTPNAPPEQPAEQIARMRVAIVASHPIQYHAPLFRALARRLEVTVLYAHRATPSDQARAGFGVGFEWDVDLLSGYSHDFLRNAARRPGLDSFAGCDIPDIGARLREGRFDAVLVFGWHLKAYVQSILAAKRLGLPVLVRGDSQLGTPRPSLKRVAKRLLYPPLLRLFDAALYVGERSRAYWLHYRYPESRLFFSPHCIDAEWFAARATEAARNELRSRLGLASDLPVALFAGKLVPFKRPLDLVLAAARLQREGREIAVLVAGDGALRPQMEAAASAAGIRLAALGFCNQSEMPSVYAAADVLVLPSDGRETWGLAASEALACGRPVILSDAAGAAPDLAQDGSAGRVFPAGDVGRLADALGELITHPPAPIAIAAKSTAYGIAAATDGIVRALAANCRTGPSNR